MGLLPRSRVNHPLILSHIYFLTFSQTQTEIFADDDDVLMNPGVSFSLDLVDNGKSTFSVSLRLLLTTTAVFIRCLLIKRNEINGFDMIIVTKIVAKR